MQLVDEGLLDLDAPVAEVLPGFRVADPDVTRSVTTRHLLTHTSGIDGDVFTDTGRGDDCLERYVAGMAEVAQNHPLGATWSYCNSGYILAGRIVEHLTGDDLGRCAPGEDRGAARPDRHRHAARGGAPPPDRGGPCRRARRRPDADDDMGPLPR